MKKGFFGSLLSGPDRKTSGLIQIFACNSLYMEGCKSVVEANDTSIVIKGKSLVRVKGRELGLKELGDGNVCALGKIEQILFEEVL